MFQRKPLSPQNETTQRDRFPTFRRLLRFAWKFLTRLPFVSRAWWKRNYRRLAAICLVFAAVWTATNIYATILLNRELAAIRQRGEPLTMAELAPPPVPDAQNAAILYAKAAAQLKYEVGDDSHLLGYYAGTMTKMPPQVVFANRKRIFERNHNVTRLLLQAAEMTNFRALRSSEKIDGKDYSLPKPYIHMRKFARFMGAQAEYQAQIGNRAQALECVNAVYRISDHIAQEPNVNFLTLTMPVECIGHAALARVLDIEYISPEEAEKFNLALPDGNLDAGFQHALFAERIFGLSFFNDPERWWQIMKSPEEFSLATWKDRFLFNILAPLRKLDAAAYLQTDFSINNAPWYAVITKQISPSFNRLKQFTEQTQDMREMARIAIALKLWKQSHKAYPKLLGELKTIPISNLQSALNRKTIGYKTKGDSFLLYSFGMNRRDDGGKIYGFDPMNPKSQTSDPSQPTQFDDGDDIAWRQSIGARLRPQ